MKHISYLDLPSVPSDLIESIQSIINKPNKEASIIVNEYPYFKTKPVKLDLHSWLQELFPFEITPQYQLIFNGLPIHIDKGNRIIAYNYILDTGGDNVKTVVYDHRYKPLQIEVIEANKWHSIRTSMLHGVHGIQSNNVRIAISISRNLESFIV